MLINVGKGNDSVDVTIGHYISMDKQIYNDLIGIVRHYDSEVSGCGLVERIEHKGDKDTERSIEYKITEIFLPTEQDNSGATTDIDVDVVHKLMTTLISKGKDVEKLKLHWHSHNTMSVFHSTTDEDNYKDLDNGDYLISLVLNKSDDILGRVDYYKYGICIKGIPIYVDIPTTDNLSKDIINSIEQLDKYTRDNKVGTVYYNNGITVYDYTKKDLKYDGDWRTREELKAKKVKQYIKSLGLTKDVIEKLQNCSEYNCEHCEFYPHPCIAFNGATDLAEYVDDDSWDSHYNY